MNGVRRFGRSPAFMLAGAIAEGGMGVAFHGPARFLIWALAVIFFGEFFHEAETRRARR